MNSAGKNFSDIEVEEEKEKKLWDKFRETPDDPENRKELVEFYLPLVAKVANKMPSNVRDKIPPQELIGAGVLGLHGAISSYSDDKQASFSTFAYKRIRGAIIDDLRSLDHLTRTQRAYYREICAAINKLTMEYSRPPTDYEIAIETNMSIADVDKYIGMGSETVNIHQEFKDGLSYIDVLPDTQTPSPDDSVHWSMAISKLKEHFHDLEEREQKILFLRHYEEMSVKEIAKVLEISEGRISQIYQKIVLKLRALMKADELRK
jgi:RNA polymerase sigma factor for flagellar operon FliA